MSTKLKALIGILVVMITVGAAVFFAREKGEPSQRPPGRSAEAEEAVPIPQSAEPAPPPAQSPNPPATPKETVAEPAIPEDLPDAVRPFRNLDEKVQSDPDAVEFLTAMKEKWGWDKMKTLKCRINMTTEDADSSGKPRTSTVGIDMAAEFPDKLSWTVEADLGGNKMNMYLVSDGRFFQYGTVTPDGARTPMDASRVDPRDQGLTLFNGDLYNPDIFRYDKPVNVRVDPNDPAFFDDDGAPPDSLDFIMLTLDRNGRKDAIYVDPSSMRVKAIKSPVDGKPASYFRIAFQEISPGLLYPSRIDAISTSGTVQAGESLHEIRMRMDVSDFEVNSAVDPAVFSFAAGGAK